MNKKLKTVLISFIMITGCNGMAPKLGIENGRLMQCPEKPNCVNSQAKDKKHFIEPIFSTGSPSESKKHILKILNESKRCKVKKVEANYIRAEFTSRVFRFVDDVEFYFQETESNEAIIHVRSASRVGYLDFGVNRKRIERIRSQYKKILRE